MPGYRNSRPGAPPASTPPTQKPAPKNQPTTTASTPRTHRQPLPARHRPRSHPNPDAPKPTTPIHAMKTLRNLGSGSDQVTSKSTSQTTSHKTRRWRTRAHVPARAQASFVVQCRALSMPSHRRSKVHDPLKPTMGTCAGQCFARAQQCPANPDASLVHQPPPPASVRTSAGSAALCRRPPQAPGHVTEPLPGQQPGPDGAARPCARHCFARAQQCPANPPVLVGQRSRKVSAPRVSVRALERCHRRTRLASPRA